MLMRLLVLLMACGLLLPAVADEPSVLLAAVGDVMLARTVPRRIADHHPSWAWENIAPLMQQADLRFCNLECPVTQRGIPVPKRYSFRADSTLTSQVLTAGKIDIVSQANNHTFDYGRVGLADTISTVAEMGIAAPGAGVSRVQAIAPRIIERNGLRIAFVAYTCWTPEGYVPSDEGASLANLDETTFADELKAAKKDADLLVVSLHWGKEYSPATTAGQQRIGHLAIDAGADLVLGHHPHVREPIEIYHDRPIIYSLGNAIFDRSDARNSNGQLILVQLAKERVTVVSQVPLKIEDARPMPEAPMALVGIQ